MAAVNEAVGPIPGGADPDAYDRLRRRVLWAMPSGLYLIGSAAGERANLMTANWAVQLSADPKLLGISVEAGALTRGLIEESGAFTLSILHRDDRPVVRKFAKPADWDPAASTLHDEAVRLGRRGVPILAAAVAWLECEVRHTLDLGSHVLFAGQIVDCGALDDIGEVLRMEDTRMSYGG